VRRVMPWTALFTYVPRTNTVGDRHWRIQGGAGGAAAPPRESETVRGLRSTFVIISPKNTVCRTPVSVQSTPTPCTTSSRRSSQADHACSSDYSYAWYARSRFKFTRHTVTAHLHTVISHQLKTNYRH